MRNPYHIPGAMFYLSRTKKGLIDQIRPFWNGKIKDLQAMDTKQLRAIIIQRRQQGIIDLMRKPVENKLTKVEYGGNVDTVKGEL